MDNTFPVYHKIIGKEDKETLLQQNAKVIWFTGLSSSGKTTIACRLEKELNKLGYLTQILDGDNVRNGLTADLNFSIESREENIRRVAEVSKLFLNCGVITINSFISPTVKIRKLAKKIIGEENYLEIFINTPIEICEERDVKGLYKKARAGLIKNFTGIDNPFEPSENPFEELKTDELSIDDSIKILLEKIIPIIKK